MKDKFFLTISVIVMLLPWETGAFGLSGDEYEFPQIKEMTAEYNYPVFTPDDLWDYINGASDGYLAFNFQQLKIAEYRDENGNVIKAEIYKFPRTEDAYGIFATERSPDYNFIDIGAQGYAEASLVNFVTGNYYVKIIKGAGDSVSEKKLNETAQIISQSLVDHPKLPQTLSVFPDDGKMAYSETFTASNVLGNEFLTDAFKSDYRSGDESFSILIFNRDKKEACIDLLEKYYAYTKESLPGSWENGQYIVHDKYNGTVNFYLKDTILFGFTGTEDPATIELYTEKVLEKLY